MHHEMIRKNLLLPDGCNLSYRMESCGADTTLMLIHGALCDASSLFHLSQAVQGRLNVLLPDLRGHGDSGNGTTPWTLELLASDMVAIAEADNAHRLILIGESFGALVAACMATLIPERIELLICSEPPLSPTRLLALRDAILSAMPTQLAASGLAKILGYAPEAQHCEATKDSFHSLLSGINRPLILLHGTGGTGALASVIDREDLSHLAGASFIRPLVVQAADHLVLRSIGSSLLRALLAELVDTG